MKAVEKLIQRQGITKEEFIEILKQNNKNEYLKILGVK